jgi:hypothetical protein
MQAIKRIIEIKNHTFKVMLPDDFTAKRVEVIILPSNVEDDIPQWQKEESEHRYNEYLQNPKIALDFDEALNEIEKGL